MDPKSGSLVSAPPVSRSPSLLLLAPPPSLHVQGIPAAVPETEWN